jgi:hypothetical protein
MPTRVSCLAYLAMIHGAPWTIHGAPTIHGFHGFSKWSWKSMESELIPTPVDSIWSSMDNPFQIPSSPCTASITASETSDLLCATFALNNHKTETRRVSDQRLRLTDYGTSRTAEQYKTRNHDQQPRRITKLTYHYSQKHRLTSSIPSHRSKPADCHYQIEISDLYIRRAPNRAAAAPTNMPGFPLAAAPV